MIFRVVTSGGPESLISLSYGTSRIYIGWRCEQLPRPSRLVRGRRL